MKLTEDAVLVIEDEDVSGMYCYRDRDGIDFVDGFKFELQLHDIVVKAGSIASVQFPEDLFNQPEEIRQAVYTAIKELEQENR
ncbi:hypothetical protein BBD42_24375 [Paenibacillus sp. BIHB 4019]|uniref:Uncharacterized protein n=1 Tax=Paenibacillus sp. BIHB 4019 TaxID=1870819 RepID=A0A1B2DNJ1_9BACL|nr:hypothetical protein [Paenibacillus sp. BIHB 4019]ANY69267.1 hypothetical protein BBD42_24375 [Paenibacillus sp. BIHB 4019]